MCPWVDEFHQVNLIKKLILYPNTFVNIYTFGSSFWPIIYSDLTFLLPFPGHFTKPKTEFSIINCYFCHSVLVWFWQHECELWNWSGGRNEGPSLCCTSRHFLSFLSKQESFLTVAAWSWVKATVLYSSFSPPTRFCVGGKENLHLSH